MSDRSRGRLRSAACERCRTRKTRCTNEQPECSACVKAEVRCLYPAAKSDQAYIRELEQRLRDQDRGLSETTAELRASQAPLPGPASDAFGDEHASYVWAHETSPLPLSDPPSDRAPLMSAVTGPNVTTEGPSLAGNNTSWSSPVASAPPSSHQLLNRLPYAPDLPQSIVSPFSSTPTYQAVNCEDITAERSHLPPNDQLWNAIRRFLNYYNSAFAVFHEPTVYAQVRSFLFDSAVARYDVCLVYTCVDGRMAYIGARSPHNPFWKHAVKHIPVTLSRHGLEKIQALHLILHYYMHNPDIGDVSAVAGMTTRAILDQGYYHERTSSHGNTANTDHLVTDLRRRAFWAAYCVDVSLSTSLGRPPSIPAEWIRVELPSEAPDDCIRPTGIDAGDPAVGKIALQYHIRMRRLQAEIYTTLYSEAATTRSPNLEWIEATQKKIDQWLADCPALPTDSFLNRDWLMLHHHLSVIMLNRPCPGNVTPKADSISRALRTSSLVMRLFRQMFRRGKINFPWLAVHHIFMSGITYLSCIMLSNDRDGPPLGEAMLDIQTCAGVLEALTAAQSSMSGIRDAFEEVSAAVIRTFVHRRETHSRHVSPTRQVPQAAPFERSSTIQGDNSLNFGCSDNVGFGMFEPSGDPTWEALNAFLMEPSGALHSGPEGQFGVGQFDASDLFGYDVTGRGDSLFGRH